MPFANSGKWLRAAIFNAICPKDLGPGETVLVTPEGIEQKNPPGNHMQICSFLWIYYGYPASSYEGINVEASRYRCGAALARPLASALSTDP